MTTTSLQIRAEEEGVVPRPDVPAARTSILMAARNLPIPLWAALVASLCMIVGWQWDICWHRSVGRDTIWTPPHVSIYIALFIAFVFNCQLVLSGSFSRRAEGLGISILGFRGPAGAFVTLMGVFLQFLAILFDAWWHVTYGLDPAVFSPPHMLIAHGINLFYFGQILLAISYRNTSPASEERITRWVILILWGMFIGHCAIGAEDAFGPLRVRAVGFLFTSTAVFPFVLVLVSAYLRWPWAAAAASSIYMGGTIVLMQILQLFPATPRYGPVFHHISHFLPPSFPLLVVVPALVMVPIFSRFGWDARPRTLGLLGAGFVASFIPVCWVFSGFLTTHWADNRLFAGGYPGSVFEQSFRPMATLHPDLLGVASVGAAILQAGLASGGGLVVGRWLRGVVR